MCGITGFFSYKNRCDTKKYYDAHLKIAHRGPDDEGFIYKNSQNNIEHLIGDDTIEKLKTGEVIYDKEPSNLIIGHRRLSIIDLSVQGHQPYSFKNLYMVYNGELYNYIELREELKEKGYIFETNTDTEVYLKAYHCWGVDAFNKFNGMWAVAIYDSIKDEVLLSRDRFGIKPLYYATVNDNLFFASEIKFVSSFFDKLEANEQMVYEYLRFNFMDHTKFTLFKEIFQLEPSCYIVYNKEGITEKKYWDLNNLDYQDIDIEESLLDSIKLRLRSDVEVGSLLSGGIDSSTILGMIDFYNLEERFQTFSAVFKEEEFSEKKYIDDFKVKNINLNKHYIYPASDRLQDTIEELIYTQEEPFRSLAVFSQYEIYKYIKNHTDVTVLLNGQGADEIFTGYTKYYYIYLLELLKTLKLKVFILEFKALGQNMQLNAISVIKNIFATYINLYIKRKDKYSVFKKYFTINNPPKKFDSLLKDSLWQSLTFSALREYLKYEDKNSMRFSLESRLPFLDYRLVQSAFSLPDELKIKNGVSKVVLRKIAKEKIPNKTLNRKDKMGFVSPQELWQKTEIKDEIENIFLKIEKEGIFDFINSKRIYELYQEYNRGTFRDWAFIWRVYCLYKWKKVWRIV